MNVVLALVSAILIALLFGRAIRRMPLVFYAGAVLAVVAYLFFSVPTTSLLFRPLQDLIQKGQLGFAFFVVVMFVGVLREDSALSRRLAPIRGELSIIGSILICGHFTLLLANYAGLVGHFFKLRPNLMVPLVLSTILLVLLALLTATSLRFVRAVMDGRLWKRIQSLAYVFFGLIYLHILGYLLVPALQGAATARASVIVYSAVFLLYATLRIRKHLLQRKQA
jgi:DMSO/TMAO reductase YedYZ heme-binding membrane subunit